MNVFISLFLLFILPSVSFANGEGSEQLFGQWTTAFINGKFGKDSPWIYFGEAGIRSSQDHKDDNGNQGYDIGSVPIRAGFGYQFDKMNSLMIGYLYQYSQPPYAKTDVNENRAWEQFQNVLDFGETGKLQNRTRFEQRTLEEGEGTSLRLRHLVKYVYPINKDWGFAFSEEVFFNINTVSWGPSAGFDQNRVFLGPVYQINKDNKIEFGYMNNYVNKDLKSDLNNDVLVINYYFNVPD
jgi:hypothetical protein